MLREWVAAILAAPNNYAILLGDQFEGTRTSFRKHIRGYLKDSNSQKELDVLMERQVDDLVEALEPVRGRLIGALMGNHYWEFCSALTSDQLLCQKLKIPFLGCEAAVRLRCLDGKKEHRGTVTLAAHHHGGSTGGRTFSGDANSLHKFEQAWDADIYLLGHTHKTLSFQTAHRRIAAKGSLDSQIRRRLFVRCGCMRSIENDEASADKPYNPDYPIQQGLPPLPLSWPEIEVICKQGSEIKFRTTMAEA